MKDTHGNIECDVHAGKLCEPVNESPAVCKLCHQAKPQAIAYYECVICHRRYSADGLAYVPPPVDEEAVPDPVWVKA